MTRPRLPLDAMPYWPRKLREHEAAAYVNRGPQKFRDEVRAGRWPKPGADGLYDRKLIDAALDREAGLAEKPNVYRERLNVLGKNSLSDPA